MTDTDTRAALSNLLDVAICRRCDRSDPIDTADRDAIDTAITAHVEAEVARRLAVAPSVEDAIDQLDRAAADRGGAGMRRVIEGVDGSAYGAAVRGSDAATDTLRAAIAADRERAVEAGSLAALDEFRKLLPKYATPDEARRMVQTLIGAMAIVGNGLNDDPGTVVAKRIASDASTALLRALGVES